MILNCAASHACARGCGIQVDIDNEDYQSLLLDFCEYMIIFDTASPDALQIAFEGFAVDRRVIASFEVFVNPIDDKISCASIHLVK